MKRRMIAMGSIAAALFVAMLPQGTVQAAAISVDGDPAEWSGIPMQASADSRVAKWAVAQDESYVYFYIQENGGNEWGQPVSDTSIAIAYADAGAAQNQCGIRFAPNVAGIKDDWYADIAGEVHAFSPSLEADRYEVEFAVPKAFFAEGAYVISYCGASVDSGSITDFSASKDTEPGSTEGGAEPGDGQSGSTEDGAEPGNGQQGSTEDGVKPGDGQSGSTEGGAEPGSTESGSGAATKSTESTGNAYNGIIIDGNFADWSAITKTPVDNGSIVETAMIFDGDYVYIYIKEVSDGCATWSGPYGNGYFAIVTDLGRTTTFKLNRDSITEISGAEVRHSNLCYEIAIPASAVKAYKNTISFGYYGAEEMLVSDVANLKEDGGDKDFNGIVFDGLYGDWMYYAHQVIQYSQTGQGCDAEGALYTEGTMLYGHVSYTKDNRTDIFNDMTLRVNQDEHTSISFRLVGADAAGNVSMNPAIYNLAPGTYLFYLWDRDSGSTAQNVGHPDAPVYGRIYVTVEPSGCEAEFEIDLTKVADRFDLDATDLMVLQTQYIRIGGQWVTIAGTSTGPVAGILLCIGMAACVLAYRKRKMGRV